MSTIQVSITGGKELVPKLNNFTRGQLDLIHSMCAMSLYLTRFFSGEVFVSRGQVIGKSWLALNPNHAVYKARKWPGSPPLIRSGL